MSTPKKKSAPKTVVTRNTFDEVIVPTYAPSNFVPVRGAGLEVWDQEGKRYLDLTAGIAVTSLGHAYPPLAEVLCDQARVLWHISNNYTNEPVLRLALTLTNSTFAERAFFCNSGAEANEAAFKLARKWGLTHFGPEKTRIVSCLNSFHGRTLFTVTVGGQPKYSQDFAPLPPQIDHIPFNDIEAARAAIGDDVCAVVVEPIQGEGGVLPANAGYLKALRDLCDKKKVLLIFDEIQCGLGRTGTLFAYMNYGVTPDIMTVAKALGNGFPIGAMLTTAKIGSVFSVGAHGTTYGGNPLASAVACKVVETIADPDFLDRVIDAGAQLVSTLQKIVSDFPQLFSEVRGRGLMQGLVLSKKYHGRSKEIVVAAEAEGLLVLVAGPDVIRFVPALIISDAQIEEGGRLLRRAAERFLKAAD